MNSCKKKDELATLTTAAATNITVNSLTSGGSITSDGGADVTARGVCYGTSATPLVSGLHTTDDQGTGSFVSNLTGLTPNTLYHIRAYATNSVGTAYGTEVTATTSPLVAPTVTTTAVSAIALTTAVSGGNVTSDGNDPVTARGVCWATTAGPTTTNSKTTDATGTGIFVSNLTGLTPGTVYYVRAYATNSVGTSYGNEISFTTTQIVVPTLTTTAITAITPTTAATGGNITADGGGTVTARGVAYATTANPTVAGTKTSDATGTGVFTSNLTGLTPNTLYHVRAYATNSAGTAYGADVSFTTSPIGVPTLTTVAVTSITLTTAVSGGTITADGSGAITARGVVWSTTTGPTIAGSKTTDGTGIGTFASTLTPLNPGTTYYVRAYATNSAGTAYGNELSFTTSPVTIATITTTAATTITQTTAVSGGNITANGGGAVTARGVCYGTGVNPTIAGSKTSDGTGSGTFTSSLTLLTPGTTYHIRAYATNSAGTAYGSDLTFVTNPVLVATLTTTAASAITQTTATSGGNVSADGGGNVTARGVCWSTSATPTISGSFTSNGTGTGSFTSALTGLTAGTLYHVRAYATNSAGTAYGNEITFTTNPVVIPSLTTTAVTSITLTAAVSGGTITSDGGGNITAKGVAVSTSPIPTILGPSDGTGTASYVSNMTGLTNSTTYYVRAYATNSAGTGYGNQLVFTTAVADNDGHTYATVTIGTQIWMAENLKTTKLTTGTAIPEITDNTAWTTQIVPAYSMYDNDPANNTKYGLIYNWLAVGTTNLCPTGWHVPSDGEYKTLESFLGMSSVDLDGYGFRGTNQGTQLKNTTGWKPGYNGTNTSGFSALPGGYRKGLDGTFTGIDGADGIGLLTYLWTSTEDGTPATKAWYRRLDGWDGVTVVENAQVFRDAVTKVAGKYVRCVKD
jgi:uncharacterized protein (TIGR02145 family)